MTSKKPTGDPSSLTKEERLAKALRDNLARRKALMRAKRERTDAGTASPGATPPERDDSAS
ncbi:hypothetical protein [Hyphomicrobium sp.]|uniref:hypothetical protein n=1 Tax=Hyphomicrobium sp. TaxID=82 RepID=UPI0025C4895F|nr:hypothetical protein [Hyphomicrobium sp.]MCC7252332.1 hypothetical protein [Hyphomicrobium sp.]